MLVAILTSNNTLYDNLQSRLMFLGYETQRVPNNNSIGSGFFRAINQNNSENIKPHGANAHDVLVLDADTPSVKTVFSKDDNQILDVEVKHLKPTDFLMRMRQGGIDTPTLALSKDPLVRNEAIHAYADETLDPSRGIASIVQIISALAHGENYDVDAPSSDPPEPEPPQDW